MMRRIHRTIALASLISAGAACSSPSIAPMSAGSPTPDASSTPVTSPTPTPAAMCSVPASQLFPAQWINGANCSTETPIQVHQVDENTWILRQSMCTNFEGPFLYLLFGQDKALLEDTGAGSIQLQPQVQSIVDGWVAAHGKPSTYPLVVVHSHGHGDHVAGDSQFQGMPNTTLVLSTVSDDQNFFGIASWPSGSAQIDLGGRVLDVIPIPGHQTAHIALYDHATGWLLTGDTLYPGRLYISDFAAYTASVQRLAAFTQSHPVCWVMGTHVEMTQTPKVDFAYQSTYHPSEHVLQLTPAHVQELSDAVTAMNGNAVYQQHDDFIISP